MGSRPALTRIELALPRARSGKVRECFDLGDRLLLVATDRISAFDCVFARGIPGKGSILTGISRFWFELLGAGTPAAPAVPHHLLTTDARRIVDEAGLPASVLPVLAGRTMLVRKTRPLPVECVVRGYLEGSALAEYAHDGRVCGIRLPPGLRRGDRLRTPLFTPATKAETGHDENISFDETVRRLGPELAERVRDLSLSVYRRGAAVLAERGLLLADTKFEFGIPAGPDAGDAPRPARAEGADLLLIDEVLTPDSSRIWEASAWEPGHAQPSFDKQPLRDWLEDQVARGLWDKRPPAPELPDVVVLRTAERYTEAYRRITGAEPTEANGTGGAG
ncbi:MAG: phosphoribosylaminoimidazolesuccinocarboxamide synthase [Gemmatimonadetes bacterium]|nr:phosphoribosylaminoimidazolesuccinocarboxamide synthase [Gemmatimonadota bacterium]